MIMRKYIYWRQVGKEICMPEFKDQILELFLRLTVEQRELAVHFAQSMLEAAQEEAAADQE